MAHRNAESTRCTAVRSTGQFCDRESLPDAPFPICLKHAAKVLAYLNDYMPQGLESRALVAARGIEQAHDNAAVRAQLKPPVRGQVYYLQVGRLIKIGHSDYLPRRLAQYPPDSKLLATEIGTRTLEAQRHREFTAALRHGNEWFEPTSELLAHIDKIKAAKAA